MTDYRPFGRFAPTPSGPLHFGSLVAALGSYLDARQAGGHWSVRIEDIDPPRCPPGASDTILRQLEAFGLYWDGPVHYQQNRDEVFQAALARLAKAGLAYPCSCSRKQWRDYPIYPRGGAATVSVTPMHQWPGDCAAISPVATGGLAGPALWPAVPGSRRPRRCGPQAQGWPLGLPAGGGDPQPPVDDADQGISDVVRGEDLLDNTPWQRQLQVALALPEPRYLHLPLIIGDDGQKLSKQNLARPLPEDARVRPLLHQALMVLGQAPDVALATAPVEDQLKAAIEAWDPTRLQTGGSGVAPDWPED